MRTHGAVVGRRFRSVTKLTTKVKIGGRGYAWGSFLIAAAALKPPTRNGYTAQGVNLNFYLSADLGPGPPFESEHMPFEWGWRTVGLGLYEVLVHFEAYAHESTILLLPPPTCITRTIAILVHVYCAIYDAPSTPLLYAIP